jgi:hypothetical protein
VRCGDCERSGHGVAATSAVDDFELGRSHLDDPIGVAGDRRPCRARHAAIEHDAPCIMMAVEGLVDAERVIFGQPVDAVV